MPPKDASTGPLPKTPGTARNRSNIEYVPVSPLDEVEVRRRAKAARAALNASVAQTTATGSASSAQVPFGPANTQSQAQTQIQTQTQAQAQPQPQTRPQPRPRPQPQPQFQAQPQPRSQVPLPLPTPLHRPAPHIRIRPSVSAPAILHQPLSAAIQTPVHASTRPRATYNPNDPHYSNSSVPGFQDRLSDSESGSSSSQSQSRSPSPVELTPDLPAPFPPPFRGRRPSQQQILGRRPSPQPILAGMSPRTPAINRFAAVRPLILTPIRDMTHKEYLAATHRPEDDVPINRGEPAAPLPDFWTLLGQEIKPVTRKIHSWQMKISLACAVWLFSQVICSAGPMCEHNSMVEITLKHTFAGYSSFIETVGILAMYTIMFFGGWDILVSTVDMCSRVGPTMRARFEPQPFLDLTAWTRNVRIFGRVVLPELFIHFINACLEPISIPLITVALISHSQWLTRFGVGKNQINCILVAGLLLTKWMLQASERHRRVRGRWMRSMEKPYVALFLGIFTLFAICKIGFLLVSESEWAAARGYTNGHRTIVNGNRTTVVIGRRTPTMSPVYWITEMLVITSAMPTTTLSG